MRYELNRVLPKGWHITPALNGRGYGHVTAFKFCRLPWCSPWRGFVSDSWYLFRLVCTISRKLLHGVSWNFGEKWEQSIRFWNSLLMWGYAFLWFQLSWSEAKLLQIRDRHLTDMLVFSYRQNKPRYRALNFQWFLLTTMTFEVHPSSSRVNSLLTSCAGFQKGKQT